MSKLGARRPSPALIISMIALFVALGGSAYAVKKVGTKEIKNNAVTAAKIKKNAVTTAKIKNNAVSGAKVNEGSLGAVPNATNAANATNAVNFSRFYTSGLKRAGIGQGITLMTVGPFTFIGRCNDEGGGYVSAYTYITSSQPGSSLNGYHESFYQGDLPTGTEVQLSDYAYSNSTLVEWDSNYGGDVQFRAASGDGQTILQGEAVNAVFYAGAQCAFWTSVTNEA